MILKRKLLRVFFIFEIVLFSVVYLFGPNGVNVLIELRKSNFFDLLEIENLKRDIDKLKSEVLEWRSNPFLKEKFARENLQMARDNDEIYYIK